ICSLRRPRAPPSPLFPYTTLFRSTWNYEEAGNQAAHDLTLDHPRCVFQLLKKNYARYTPEMVERITGIPQDQFLKAADLFTSVRSEEHTSELQSLRHLVCRLLLEK